MGHWLKANKTVLSWVVPLVTFPAENFDIDMEEGN